MPEYTEEQFEAAKAASSKEELIEMARGSGVELTDEEAERFMAMKKLSELDPQSMGEPGEIPVEELENVAGGWCKDKRGREVLSPFTLCIHDVKQKDGTLRHCGGGTFIYPGSKSNCTYLSYEKALWYCNYNVKPHG